ncbi:hypothetical protein N4R57_15935 [Rhodobacteraceae bacterium D3-12]|nr:hypothetical protein N4R57_15935 [Rhodobacteraceae bacterium D3-12]
MQEKQTKSLLTVTRDDLLADGSDLAFRKMLHNLLAFSARLEQVRSRFGAYIGLTGPQYTILITTRQLQGAEGVGVGAVAEHLAHSAAFVTAETNKLAKLGILNKLPHPKDRRRVRLSVTERGLALLESLAKVQSEINDQLFEPVDAGNFDMLQTLSRDLRESAVKALLMADYLLPPDGGTS